MTPLLIPLITWDQFVIPLMGFLITGGSLGAFLTYRLGKKKLPIDSNTAAAVLSEKAGNLALAVAERADKKMITLEEKQDRQRKDMDAMAAELARKGDLLDKVVHVIHGFREWYDGKIVQQWDTVRQQPVPPDPPLEMKHWDDNYSSLITGRD